MVVQTKNSYRNFKNVFVFPEETFRIKLNKFRIFATFINFKFIFPIKSLMTKDFKYNLCELFLMKNLRGIDNIILFRQAWCLGLDLHPMSSELVCYSCSPWRLVFNARLRIFFLWKRLSYLIRRQPLTTIALYSLEAEGLEAEYK